MPKDLEDMTLDEIVAALDKVRSQYLSGKLDLKKSQEYSSKYELLIGVLRHKQKHSSCKLTARAKEYLKQYAQGGIRELIELAEEIDRAKQGEWYPENEEEEYDPPIVYEDPWLADDERNGE